MSATVWCSLRSAARSAPCARPGWAISTRARWPGASSPRRRARAAAVLRAAIPTEAAPFVAAGPNGSALAFLPAIADGGATAAAFAVLAAHPGDWSGAESAALAAARAHGLGTAPALPASTSFVAVDRSGQAVACAVTMGNLFGTGRTAGDTGILLGASPRWMPAPLLAAGIATRPRGHRFLAAAGGAGQQAAPVAAAAMLAEALRPGGPPPAPGGVPNPARANVVACPRGLPGATGSCSWTTDPRGAGYAAGSP